MPVIHKVDCECYDCKWSRGAAKEEAELESLLEVKLSRINELKSDLESLRFDVSRIRQDLASHRSRRKAQAKKMLDPLRAEKEAEKERQLTERRERWDKVIAMRESGMSFGLIGEAIGVSASTAKAIHKKAERVKSFEARFGLEYVGNA